MRELFLKMSMSVDGFVSDLEGRNTWMFGSDQAAKAWSVETVSNASLHIMGHRTFAEMAAYWPTSTDQFAPPMNRIPKAVFARSGTANGPAPVAAPETLSTDAKSWSEAYVASGDLTKEISALKAVDGRPIIAHGGVRFARSLVASGLVDQLILMVVPVALGDGLPLFSSLPAPAPLKLLSSNAFPGGAVAQTYRFA